MSPRVKEAINEAATLYSVHPIEVIGPKKRRTKKAIKARWHVIAKLYDPSSAGPNKSMTHHKWGLSEISRQLGICHTTVFYAVEKMRLRA